MFASVVTDFSLMLAMSDDERAYDNAKAKQANLPKDGMNISGLEDIDSAWFPLSAPTNLIL